MSFLKENWDLRREKRTQAAISFSWQSVLWHNSAYLRFTLDITSSIFHHPLSFFCFFSSYKLEFSSFTAHINCLCLTLNSLSSRSSLPEVSGEKYTKLHLQTSQWAVSSSPDSLDWHGNTCICATHLPPQGKERYVYRLMAGFLWNFFWRNRWHCAEWVCQMRLTGGGGGCDGYREPQEQWERDDKRHTEPPSGRCHWSHMLAASII